MWLMHDMLIRLKNGYQANLLFVLVKYSKFCELILNKLYVNGFILFYKKIYINKKVFIKVYLKKTATIFFLKHLKILSKPSKHLTISYKDLNYSRLKMDKHFIFLSTSIGILTNLEALDKRIGGFLLFKFLI